MNGRSWIPFHIKRLVQTVDGNKLFILKLNWGMGEKIGAQGQSNQFKS